MTEELLIRTSLYGRLADECSRSVLKERTFGATLLDSGESAAIERALVKEDGYFVFRDLGPSATDYAFRVDATSYQSRDLAMNLPSESAVEVTYPGEDELYVEIVSAADVLNSPDPPLPTVTFAALPFTPTIHAGATVIGPGAFAETLAAPIEGDDVELAVLSSIAGLSGGEILRFVRSSNLLMRPAPYDPLPADRTAAVVRVVEDTTGELPLARASLLIDAVNGAPLVPETVGDLILHTVSIAGATTILGPDHSLRAVTDERGYTAFYFPSDTPIVSVHAQVEKTGYAPDPDETITVEKGERTIHTVKLSRL